MTRSNWSAPGGTKLAIDSGLIMKTGLIAWMALPAFAIRFRSGRKRPFFSNSCHRTAIWPLPLLQPVIGERVPKQRATDLVRGRGCQVAGIVPLFGFAVDHQNSPM